MIKKRNVKVAQILTVSSLLILIISILFIPSLLPQSQDNRSRAVERVASEMRVRTPTIRLGSITQLIKPAIGGFPSMFTDGTGTHWISYALNPDGSSLPPKCSLWYKSRGQSSWTHHAQSICPTSTAILSDGSALSILEKNPKSGLKATLTIYKRNPSSLTWSVQKGALTLSSNIAGANVYFNNGIFRIGDTLYAPYYIARSVYLAVSKDGINWVTSGTIFKVTSTTHFTETSVTHLGNGVMYAVARRETPTATLGKGHLPLAYAVSTDYGKTWSGPSDVKVGGAVLNEIAMPKIIPIKGNRFALLTGRPDNYLIAGVKSGNNITWLTKKLIYSNYNTANRYLGSSGYIGGTVTSSAPTLANIFTVFDSCAPGWGCNTKYGTFTSTSSPHIYMRSARITW